ncbi:low molecular weight phosphotyrosine protein phosphatase [Kitasatospora sp. NPDC085895]|uniref:arsenate reductase/protein-tyrosine-phosphatase family protein n=1 Tax=Kitasatospora sp. NPDC085895 TaxID=3155057 RepID=UPI00344E100F
MNDNDQTGRPRRILTVCKGGHCRAPLAAAVLARHGGTAVETRAAAIRPWHIGEGAHPAMVAAAARCGYDLTGHRGIQVSPELLGWADVVLAMDQSVHDALTAQITDPATLAKVHLYLDGRDVPDPWEQPEEAFIACVTVVETGANRHLAPTPA